jgi:integrase
MISAWMESGTVSKLEPDPSNDLTVAELCAQYLRWATGYYVKGGKPTSQLRKVQGAIRTLRRTYPDLAAKDFSPLKLKHVRQRYIDEGLSRVTCNKYIAILTNLFGFGVENELVPPDLVHGLREVKSLARDRSEARETDPVLPVEREDIEATLEELTPKFRAIVKLQLLLACRPGELLSMRPREIDRSGPVWIYRPATHKTVHHGKSRIIPIGPRAQLLLKPLLPADQDRFVFLSQFGSPLHGQDYRRAIALACLRAGIPEWTPNQLRHAGATRIREQASLDAAQVILGHSTIATTQIYAERNLEAAIKIAAEVG